MKDVGGVGKVMGTAAERDRCQSQPRVQGQRVGNKRLYSVYIIITMFHEAPVSAQTRH